MNKSKIQEIKIGHQQESLMRTSPVEYGVLNSIHCNEMSLTAESFNKVVLITWCLEVASFALSILLQVHTTELSLQSCLP